MSNKEGMITKKDFMAMMEKRFDMMDKNKKGMIHASDAMKIFSDKP
jgi:Ca2+-binding EF-hand superfamily protein